MIWIDFPGVNVENHGPILTQDFAAHLPDYRIGKQTEISSTEKATTLSQHIGHGDRELHESSCNQVRCVMVSV